MNNPKATILSFASQAGSWVAILLGSLGLVGWTFVIGRLKTVFHGLPSMVPNTALSFVLAGFSLWLLRTERASTLPRRTGQACALAVTLIATLTLCEYLFNWDHGIDQWLLGGLVSKFQSAVPARPSFLSALNFLLLGPALLLMDSRSRSAYKPNELLSVTAILISLLALIGHVCKVPVFYGWRSLYHDTGMALHTLAGFTAFGLGLLCARPAGGLMELVTSPTASGSLARRLLLAPVIIPLMTGGLNLASRRMGIYNAELASWLFAFLNIFIFTVAIWWCSSLLHREEIVRRRAQEDLNALNALLETRVNQRTTELRESERLLRLVIDLVPHFIFAKDAESRHLFVNRVCAEARGLTPEQMVGLCDLELLSDRAQAEAFMKDDQEVIASGLPKSIAEEPLTDSTGRTRFLQTIKIPFTAPGTGERALLGVAVDITERKQAQEKMAWLASFPEFNPNPVIELDLAAGVVWYVNPSAARLFPDLQNQGLRHPLLAGVPEAAREVIEARTEVARREIRVDECWYAEAINYVRDAQRVRVYCSDITERKQAEEAARALRAMEEEKRIAVEANLAKTRFLAGMSHELRTPLNGIIGFAEFLVDGKPGSLNSKQKEYLEDILKSGRHLLELINDVLDLAKVDAGKMELNPTTFPLETAIEEVCGVVQPIANKKNIQVRTSVAAGLDQVTIDPQKFKQVLYNLLSNAVKFTDEGGCVEIIAAPEGLHQFKLSVRDTGIGIKPADLNRLFREFEQLDAGADRQYEGTGLGLALTRKVVELQGGAIKVESEVGQGSTFTVILGQRL